MPVDSKNDLAEIRRYWPKARQWCSNGYGVRGANIVVEDDGVYVYRPQIRFVRATIAAAMAAAGFGKRKHDEYAGQRQHKSRWVTEFQRGEGGLFSMTPLVYRQRPCKGVRLGGKARRLACWMAIYRDSSLVTAAQVRASYRLRLAPRTSGKG
jgi:hypothetical protein